MRAADIQASAGFEEGAQESVTRAMGISMILAIPECNPLFKAQYERLIKRQENSLKWLYIA